MGEKETTIISHDPDEPDQDEQNEKEKEWFFELLEEMRI